VICINEQRFFERYYALQMTKYGTQLVQQMSEMS